MEDVRLLSSVCLPHSPQTTVCSLFFSFFIEEQVIQALVSPCYSVCNLKDKNILHIATEDVCLPYLWLFLLSYINAKTVLVVNACRRTLMSHVTAVSQCFILPWVCVFFQVKAVMLIFVFVMKACDSEGSSLPTLRWSQWVRVPLPLRMLKSWSHFLFFVPLDGLSQNSAPIVNMGPLKRVCG